MSRRTGRLVGEWLVAATVALTCLRRVLSEDFLLRPPIADRGTFILYSKLVANGAVLYRDVFDNKPPGIHLLGAFAWRLSPEVRAVFQMERVAILLLAGVMFAMLRYGFRVRWISALAGLVVGLITLRNPDVFSGGHLTEEYGILFEMTAVTSLVIAARMPPIRCRHAWFVAAGGFAAMTLMTRQAFVLSLFTIWTVVHAALIPGRGLSPGIVCAELVGFALPSVSWLGYVWWVGALTSFLELFPESYAYVAAPSTGGLGSRLASGIHWMIMDVFHGRPLFALAVAGASILALWAVHARMRPLAKGAQTFFPVMLPLWFIAELVAASVPGTLYGHYYIGFVPVWACLAALIVEEGLPPVVRRRRWDVLRATALLAAFVGATIVLDASYRAEPTKGWWLFAADPRLPRTLVEQLRSDADRFGWKHYVPLMTIEPGILLDMPLAPGTRFLAQYPYQFPGVESPRGRELVSALEAADVIVYDRRRLRLDRSVEPRVQTILRSSFTPLFEWSHFRFLARRPRPTP